MERLDSRALAHQNGSHFTCATQPSPRSVAHPRKNSDIAARLRSFAYMLRAHGSENIKMRLRARLDLLTFCRYHRQILRTEQPWGLYPLGAGHAVSDDLKLPTDRVHSSNSRRSISTDRLDPQSRLFRSIKAAAYLVGAGIPTKLFG